MKTFFTCPDGGVTGIADCWRECRMGERCAPLSFLHEAGREREWKGKPSCTQLLNGTRMSYLMLTTEWGISPQDATWQILGSAGHAVMERAAEVEHAEIEIDLWDITGHCDFIEVNSDGSVDLYDYKVVGSYAVAKALGVTVEKDPMLDNDGNPMLWRGRPRYKSRVVLDSEKADLRDWKWQVNFYRWGLWHAFKPVRRQRLFLVARDGGTVTARGYGVMQNFYMVDVPAIAEEVVREHFEPRREALLSALHTSKCPAPCSAEEAWNGNRCRSYCAVAGACVARGDNPYISETGGETDE